ncbi:MAG: hypothetical protein HYY83_09720, partial [Deltaproteobacteria bacterium]|nr:hypothetical protein [Deltaproteobacteria bacterium]
DVAAELLAEAPLNVIVYAFTSSSYVLGPDGDAALKTRLEGRTRGIPVLLPGLSAGVVSAILEKSPLGMIEKSPTPSPQEVGRWRT